jgi:hypothetical protein
MFCLNYQTCHLVFYLNENKFLFLGDYFVEEKTRQVNTSFSDCTSWLGFDQNSKWFFERNFKNA